MDWVESFVSTYGCWAVFVLTFFEGETVVLLAAFAAHQGMLNIYCVTGAAFIGSLAGDQTWFLIGRKWGHAIFDRFLPKWKPKVVKIAHLLERHQNLVMVFFRFFYGLRNPTPLVIGMSRISRWRFLMLNALGAVIWSISFAAAGWYFGKAVTVASKDLQIALSVGLLLVIGIVVYLVRRRLRRKTQAEEPVAVPEKVTPTSAG